MTHVKICGIKTPEMLRVAAQAGARFIGFVFYPPSPRYVAVDTAKELALMLPTGVRGVGLFVDPTDGELEDVLGKVQLDMIQLHGSEPPERVREIKEKYAMPILKAFAVREADDLLYVESYDAADWFLFDAKPSSSSTEGIQGGYGGSGESFDWLLLQGKNFSKPWMLSGGLTPQNLAQALEILKPDAADVSSGVESSRGVKDADKIRAFITAAKRL